GSVQDLRCSVLTVTAEIAVTVAQVTWGQDRDRGRRQRAGREGAEDLRGDTDADVGERRRCRRQDSGACERRCRDDVDGHDGPAPATDQREVARGGRGAAGARGGDAVDGGDDPLGAVVMAHCDPARGCGAGAGDGSCENDDDSHRDEPEVRSPDLAQHLRPPIRSAKKYPRYSQFIGAWVHTLEGYPRPVRSRLSVFRLR